MIKAIMGIETEITVATNIELDDKCQRRSIYSLLNGN
jgi:hypothetical protein